MYVQDVMQTKLFTVTPETTLPEALNLTAQRGIRHLPVLDGERLVGIVSDRDLKRAMASPATSLEAHELRHLLDHVLVPPLLAPPDPGNPASGVTAAHLAYMIYTSGSTGRPKGVLIPHRGLGNLVQWHLDTFAVTAADRTTQVAAFAFDAAVWEVWPPLVAGACLVLVPPEVGPQPRALQDWLVTEQITMSFLPTPLAEEVLALAWPVQPALRLLLTGGDRLHTYPPATWPCVVVNNYGPTENTVVTTSGQVVAGVGGPGGPAIGRPIANTQGYLLDRRLQPIPLGVAGELYIGGVSLARGYLNRPALTAEVFLPHPYSAVPGQRLYKTGDLARYLSDGNLEFLGRTDEQVKLRGFRIELGEIEAVLAQHPAVETAAVLARTDAPGEKRLVAYVVCKPAFSVEPPELRRFMQAMLPAYMVPGTFVLMPAMPLTPNGKVDRRALPAPDPSRREVDEELILPRMPTEELLAGLWAEVLRLEQVGIHDNFFALGGDSILGIQIIARANLAGLQLTPKQLFQYQTIAELATVAGTTIPTQAEQGLVTGPIPLTPIQHWFFEQYLPEPHHFNQFFLLEAPSDLTPETLERVVRQLLLHHDALRLRFIPSASGWQQINLPPDETVPFTMVDLIDLAPEVQQRALESAAAVLQTSLSLTEGPLLRVALFSLGVDKPCRLLLVMHHLVVDGISWRIILEDLATAYQQLSQNNAVYLPPKTTSFKEWAYRLTEYAQSPTLAAELDYWLEASRSKVGLLPVDYRSDKETNTVASASHVSVSLSTEQTRALLQQVPQVYNTQITDVLLTALAQGFAQWTGEPVLLLDLEGHGREELFADVDLSRTVGWFTTIFPVLLDLRGVRGPGEALKAVKEQLRRLPHRGIGYGLLRYLSQDTPRHAFLRLLPQAEVSFNYLGQFDQVLSPSSLFMPAQESGGAEHSPLGKRHYLLEVNGFVAAGSLQLVWKYSKNVHKRATVEHLAQGFIEALILLIAHCQSPEAGGYTPSDFPAARANQKDIDKLADRIRQSRRR